MVRPSSAMASHMVGAWFHMRAAMPAGEYSRFSLLAKSGPRDPPSPLMLWQRTHGSRTNSSAPRCESTDNASLACAAKANRKSAKKPLDLHMVLGNTVHVCY